MKLVILFVVVCLARFGGGAVMPSPSTLQVPSYADGLGIKEQANQISSTEPAVSLTAPDTECLAGSEWESNCHSCKCSDDGVASCEKHATCPEDSGDPIKCKPSTTFVRGCNTCVCLDNGQGLCSLENCRKTTTLKKSELQSGKDCAPGSYWKSQCNDCGCSPTGYSVCTEKACPNQEIEPAMRCAPDTIWNNECNTCWCTTDGLPMCTKMGCVDISELNFATSESSSQSAVPEPNDDIQDHLKKLDEPDPNIEENNKYIPNNPISDREDMQIAESHYNLEYDDYNIDHNEDLSTVDSLYDLRDNLDNFDDNVIDDDEKHAKIRDIEYKLVKETESHNVFKRSVCKPNQEFQSECNSCKCASDGQSYRCTHNECMEGETNKEVEVFMENEGMDHIERHSVCKAAGTFYIGCNTCHCNPYGTDYSCTNKPCPLPEDVELFHELKATKSSKNVTQKVVCVANRMFIKDCNTCWCNDEGTGFFCTRKVCVPELPDEAGNEESKPEGLRIILKECRPDEVFEMDCNMCRCNPDGKSFSCTRRACVEPIDPIVEEAKNSSLSRKTRGAQVDTPKTCQPGQEFRLDCNKCLCDNEGQDFSCTRNDCNALNNHNGGRSKRETSTPEEVPTECSPGSVFDRDCNVCRCTADGHHAMCTMKRCNVPTTTDAELSTPQPDSDPNFRCNPGEQFKRGCNDCSCSADGKSVFCTVRFCDQDITVPPSL